MTTDPKVEALEARMNTRLEALAAENLRLKRSARRYARWSAVFIAVTCVGALSYAWAIKPLTDTGTTAPSAAGEVKTEFAEGNAISAGDFSTNFENLVLKVNEVATQVDTNTARPFVYAHVDTSSLPSATSTPSTVTFSQKASQSTMDATWWNGTRLTIQEAGVYTISVNGVTSGSLPFPGTIQVGLVETPGPGAGFNPSYEFTSSDDSSIPFSIQDTKWLSQGTQVEVRITYVGSTTPAYLADFSAVKLQ